MIDTLWAMDQVVILTFMGAAFLLYLSPGADMMFVLASGISGGPKAGLAAAIGISMGVMVHVGLAAGGVAALLLTYPAAYDVVRYAGASYLAFLAWQSWTSASDLSDRKGRPDIRRAFRRGFVTNILNPKVVLFVLAFLPQFTDPSVGPVWHQIIWLGVMLGLGGILTDGIYGIFAGVLADKLRRSSSALSKVSAIVFAGLAARIALD